MLKAGRVGVAPTEVDAFGHITGGSSGGYTKEEADAKFATKSNTYTKSGADTKFETKANIGGLQFRDNNGTAQYKLPDGDWTNFNKGVGMNLTNPSTENLEYAPTCTLVSGGYQVEDGICYVDCVVEISAQMAQGTSFIGKVPAPITGHEPVLSVTTENTSANTGAMNRLLGGSNTWIFTNVTPAGTYRITGQYDIAV